MEPLRVAVVGATGVAGQQFVTSLENHPFFRIAVLAASERSVGKTYRESLKDENGKLRWYSEKPPSSSLLEMRLVSSEELLKHDIDLIFTALDTEVAKQLEPMYAEQKPVFSTASAFRYEADVPLVIPSVNPHHLRLVNVQRSNRNWKGFILPIPNCTTTGLVCSLSPLMMFNPRKVFMVSLQALSGAGRSPGVVALDILDNVIPYIPKEEEKVEVETKKILGNFTGSSIENSSIEVSCTCTRVSVIDGHTEAVFLSLDTSFTLEDIRRAYESYLPQQVKYLPSTPEKLFILHDDPFRPQPRLDRESQQGMAVHVGRLRLDKVANGIKYVLLSHNTKLGAAKGSLWLAELCRKTGLI